MKYVEDVLGVKIQYSKWEKENQLPYFIIERYGFQTAYIGKTRILFVYPKVELENITAVKKHMARIQKEEVLPIVLVLESINRYRRGVLISEHIAFVVPNKQIYLPFLGIALEEKYDVEIKVTEKFQPSTQLLFFYYLYKKNSEMYTNQAVERLGFSAMTITRAAKQLVQTGLFSESKDGVQKILTGKHTGKELFDKAKPYLFNPVRKRIYIQKTDVRNDMPLAGVSMLSTLSMLNPSDLVCYATESKDDIKGAEKLMDSATQVEVELWKYNPVLLGEDNQIDILSLVMSFDENEDERIEEAIETLLEKVWEE